MAAASHAFGSEIARRAISDRASHQLFFGVAALLFVASAAITIVWCRSMPAMPGMPMPGGWTMTMTWMRMPGQTWLEGAASFPGMWTVMMVAMMLPSLAPRLWRYREALESAGVRRPGPLTALAGIGYFIVWAVVGLAIYPLGIALAEIAMQRSELSRAVPIGSTVIVLVAGAMQFTVWKARQLACCRMVDPGRVLPANARTAWRHGMRLGFDCVRCCGNLMVILLVLGVMDLRAMAVVTAVITLERRA